MSLLSYRLDESHLVVELWEVVDLDNEPAIEQELLTLLPCCGPNTLIVDVLTPLLTPRALGVLLRVRGEAEQRGVSIAVVARHETAREVLSAAALNRVLRVAYSLQGAELRSRGCRPGADAPRKGRLRQRLEQRITPSDPPPPPSRAVGPYADTSLPRFPRRR
ncbi:STAS domain-containing protein [Streptomyces sp. NPDC012389]|uniref:STAS domain-containing protein n=1 Tax=unclassified Streptomyces TaxID=2593676 RepID=UPI00081E03B1|nr:MULTISPECIES: STAS domain-containing protein [unclassified Streptomyces]MYR97650.1 anti-sigma factor antagonist [Streptomyces sp. SID4937]MYX12262.1 anti-sigma factor antagonist [Streptomyces sp. SID8374]SCE28150.1 Anti-anti-sigma regulatory factor (antagonist of anti-sigma factor) [Streptomyces sp. ScaeMP-e83]